MKEEPPILGHRPSIPLGHPRATEAPSPARPRSQQFREASFCLECPGEGLPSNLSCANFLPGLRFQLGQVPGAHRQQRVPAWIFVLGGASQRSTWVWGLGARRSCSKRDLTRGGGAPQGPHTAEDALEEEGRGALMPEGDGAQHPGYGRCRADGHERLPGRLCQWGGPRAEAGSSGLAPRLPG